MTEGDKNKQTVIRVGNYLFKVNMSNVSKVDNEDNGKMAIDIYLTSSLLRLNRFRH